MKILLSLLVLIHAFTSFACDLGRDEISMRLVFDRFEEDKPVNDFVLFHRSDVNQEIYERLVQKVQTYYEPIFAKTGFKFKVESFWNSDEDNAFAGFDQEKNLKTVVIYGGYARKRFMTEDAFLSVICHEVGHHLGGFPKKTTTKWASIEGQADYFSSLRCMKDLLKNDPRNKQMEDKLKLLLNNNVVKACRNQHSKDDDYLICLRSAQASLDYGKVLLDINFRGMNMDVSLTTPSIETRTTMRMDHPSPQCRVDTKLQGALCTNIGALSDTDEFLGTCNSKIGARPNCWYVPGQTGLLK